MSVDTYPDLHAAVARALGENNGSPSLYRTNAVMDVVRLELARRDRQIAELTDERDRARRWAETLEQQLHREREIAATPEPEFDDAGEKL